MANHVRLTGQVQVECPQMAILRRRDRHVHRSGAAHRRERQRRLHQPRRTHCRRTGRVQRSEGTRHVLPGVGHHVARRRRRSRAVRQSGSGRLLLRRHDREARPAEVPADARRLHHLRPADAAMGGHQQLGGDHPERLRDRAKHAAARQGRAVDVPAAALLPDQERRSRHRVSASHLRHVDAARPEHSATRFFWAIGQSQDATFFHDWFTRIGQGAGAEYRYVASQGSYGNFRVLPPRPAPGGIPAERTGDAPAGAVFATRSPRAGNQMLGTVGARARAHRLHHEPRDAAAVSAEPLSGIQRDAND